MNLLNKIFAIEIKADTRISEEDRKVCQTHQKAYKRAREMFLLLDEQWSAFVDEEQEIMSAVTDDSYIRERYYHTEGFSIASIRNKIEYLPELLIYSIVHYFNDKYHVSVADDEVKKVLIPPKPKYDWEKSRIAEYHEKMKNMELHYEDILEQIFVQLGGRTFEERALDELKEMCHDFAWNTHYNKALYEIKNDTIQFTGRGCRYKYYYSQGEWEISDGMKSVLRALAHFETQQLDYLPKDIALLVGHADKYSSSYVFDYEKFKKIRLFKNSRVVIKFAGKELAHQFAERYLGLVA